MKIKNRLVSVFVIVFLFSGLGVLAQNDEDWDEKETYDNSNKRAELIEDAKESRSIFKDKNDELEDLFQSAYAYAIFPNVGSGAYILGGAAGNGVVYEQGELVGFAELRQIDIGLQIGGQAFRQVILFKNQAALNDFKSGDFEIGGNISAVVIEQGEARSIRFQDGIAVATMPKAGAMVELSVGGQKFEYADDWKNK
ncbi:lipid-binding SYLF domain-containing protein [Gramella sp. GC03-9]|uniref:Lipid-binding SYLF domain-containing protein n=1 Tax=Christiangramia oceanisediminis TaxID=2920386 RepID=A0A9X2I176_9FLAO|nr:lipid-binding SYLF domain-containing protein [Gramella oceanisediminis]MCP9199061.1 lipid-binding SYLF domain-containing protein [Gramella oceanisediminis]